MPPTCLANTSEFQLLAFTKQICYWNATTASTITLSTISTDAYQPALPLSSHLLSYRLPTRTMLDSAPLTRRHILATALLIPMLTGCGFTLRRYDSYAFRSLHIHDETGASPTLPLLEQALAGTSVHVTTGAQAASAADVILRIHSDTTEQHTAALAAGGSVRALLLQQQLVFSLHSRSGAIHIDHVAVRSTRHISYSDSLAVAKQAELEQTYTHMRHDIVRQLLRQLERVPASAPH